MASRIGLIHLHCGDAAAAVHRRSGLPGDLRVWLDSPAVGPWTTESGDLTALRATWWGAPLTEMRDLPHLQDLARADEPVLWFGPDPWEQACLLWILAELPEGLLPGLVPLHCGVARMPPAALSRSFAERTLLEADTLGEARALWNVFLTEGWGALGGTQVVELPWLGQALARLAEDHPPVGPGRTRRQIQGLVDQGVQDLPALMRALGQLEDARHGAWHGDLFVARMVEAMGVRLG
jgi:hypothetical protein